MNHFVRAMSAALLLVLVCGGSVGLRPAQSDAKAPIIEGIKGLRQLSDADRAAATRSIAKQIRGLPASQGKVDLAISLANLSTEGDFGKETLQMVADTLVQAVRESPPPRVKDRVSYAYVQLAQFARYEEVSVALDNPDFKAALAQIDEIDTQRAKADFTAMDLKGNTWKLSDLKGKVVLVNFWATWCPPCRKEMPDLNALHHRFKDDLVILAISDEERPVVEKYLGEHPVDFPVLLDPDRKVNTAYAIDSIPKSFIYDRESKMVAQTIDMRTMGQFLRLLEKAGLK